MLKISVKHQYKLFLAGAGAVGKTTLRTRLTTGDFAHHNETIGIDFASYHLDTPGGKTTLQIWDFAGQERFRTILPTLCKGSNGCLLLFDLTRRESFDELPGWIRDFRAGAGDVPFLLCGTKYDLIAVDPDMRCASDEEISALINDHELQGYIEVSAKTGERVVDAFKWIAVEMILREESPQEAGATPRAVTGTYS